MISLSDKQFAAVMDAAASLPVEKRALLLERIAARLRLVGTRFDDRDLELAVRPRGEGPRGITHWRPS
jgi:hypothetical protein